MNRASMLLAAVVGGISAVLLAGCERPAPDSGTISGTIALDSRPGRNFGHAERGSSVVVAAHLANSRFLDAVGIGRAGDVQTDAHGFRTVDYVITDLPLDTPLKISVKPTIAISPKFSELGGGFSTIVTFRSRLGMRPVELTAKQKTFRLDFTPLDLQIVAPNSPVLKRAPVWETP